MGREFLIGEAEAAPPGGAVSHPRLLEAKPFREPGRRLEAHGEGLEAELSPEGAEGAEEEIGLVHGLPACGDQGYLPEDIHRVARAAEFEEECEGLPEPRVARVQVLRRALRHPVALQGPGLHPSVLDGPEAREGPFEMGHRVHEGPALAQHLAQALMRVREYPGRVGAPRQPDRLREAPALLLAPRLPAPRAVVPDKGESLEGRVSFLASQLEGPQGALVPAAAVAQPALDDAEVGQAPGFLPPVGRGLEQGEGLEVEGVGFVPGSGSEAEPAQGAQAGAAMCDAARFAKPLRDRERQLDEPRGLGVHAGAEPVPVEGLTEPQGLRGPEVAAGMPLVALGPQEDTEAVPCMDARLERQEGEEGY